MRQHFDLLPLITDHNYIPYHWTSTKVYKTDSPGTTASQHVARVSYGVVFVERCKKREKGQRGTFSRLLPS